MGDHRHYFGALLRVRPDTSLPSGIKGNSLEKTRRKMRFLLQSISIARDVLESGHSAQCTPVAGSVDDSRKRKVLS